MLDSYEPLQAHVARHMAPAIQSVVGVDDILQQVFAQVFRDIAKFESRDEGSFFAWLKTIADNRLRDAIRHQGRQKRGGEFRRVTGAPEGDTPLLDDLVNEFAIITHTPSREIARREAVQAIRVAMANLPEDYRQVVELRYFEGLTVEQTAGAMNKTTGAVRGLMDRAKAKIRETMQSASRYFSDG